MKKIDKKYIIIILFGLTLICISLIVYNISNNRKQLFIENVIKDTYLFVEKIVLAPINYVDNKIKEIKNVKQLSEKYNKLKEKEDSYNLLESKYNETLKELKELQKMLSLKELALDYTNINANVINRNIGYWFNIITINKGSKDNIEVGDAVITSEGIIGEIINVSPNNSNVKLLTNNEENEISVKIILENQELYGLLTSYDQEKKVFIIEGISENIEIPVDTKVVTAGLANNYPPGIIIGYVTNIVSDNFDLARTLEVKPSANFNDIKYVTVLHK